MSLILGVLSVAAVAGDVIYAVAPHGPTPIQVDPKLYDEYAGHYFFDPDDVMTFRRKDDRLPCEAPGYLPAEMFPETHTRFVMKDDPVRISFHKDDQGQVDHLTFAVSSNERGAKAIKRKSLPSAPTGTQGMIAATTGGAATLAGLEVLKAGGNAMDAALATALTQVVQSAGSYVSFAGPMTLMYYDAATQKVYCLNAHYNTPLEETQPRSIPKTGGRTALVPGFMAGVEAAHERFGKL